MPPERERCRRHRGRNRRYGSRLAGSTRGRGHAQAVRDLLALCRREHVQCAASSSCPKVPASATCHTPAFPGRGLEHFLAEPAPGRRAGNGKLIDARTGVPDNGFLDVDHSPRRGRRTVPSASAGGRSVVSAARPPVTSSTVRERATPLPDGTKQPDRSRPGRQGRCGLVLNRGEWAASRLRTVIHVRRGR